MNPAIGHCHRRSFCPDFPDFPHLFFVSLLIFLQQNPKSGMLRKRFRLFLASVKFRGSVFSSCIPCYSCKKNASGKICSIIMSNTTVVSLFFYQCQENSRRKTTTCNYAAHFLVKEFASIHSQSSVKGARTFCHALVMGVPLCTARLVAIR